MNIVYCVTENYIEKIKPSIRSVRDHNPKAKIFIVTEADQVDIENVNVIDIRGQEWFTPNNCVNYGNMFTYIGLLKVCYSKLLPVDKVIHLDADTIVNGSLMPMWKTDLNGKWFALVQEYNGRYKPFGARYYNCGVMLLNLKQIRKDGIEEKMIEYLRYVRQPWCEQDAFNKYGLMHDMIVDLDVRYNENVMTGFTENPVIVHYCSIGNWWTNPHMDRVEYLNKYR